MVVPVAWRTIAVDEGRVADVCIAWLIGIWVQIGALCVRGAGTLATLADLGWGAGWGWGRGVEVELDGFVGWRGLRG